MCIIQHQLLEQAATFVLLEVEKVRQKPTGTDRDCLGADQESLSQRL